MVTLPPGAFECHGASTAIASCRKRSAGWDEAAGGVISRDSSGGGRDLVMTRYDLELEAQYSTDCAISVFIYHFGRWIWRIPYRHCRVNGGTSRKWCISVTSWRNCMVGCHDVRWGKLLAARAEDVEISSSTWCCTDGRGTIVELPRTPRAHTITYVRII